MQKMRLEAVVSEERFRWNKRAGGRHQENRGQRASEKERPTRHEVCTSDHKRVVISDHKQTNLAPVGFDFNRSVALPKVREFSHLSRVQRPFCVEATKISDQ